MLVAFPVWHWNDPNDVHFIATACHEVRKDVSIQTPPFRAISDLETPLASRWERLRDTPPRQ